MKSSGIRPLRMDYPAHPANGWKSRTPVGSTAWLRKQSIVAANSKRKRKTTPAGGGGGDKDHGVNGQHGGAAARHDQACPAA